MPKSQGLRASDPLGRVGVNKQLNDRISQPQHPQVILLGRTPGLLFQGEAQLIDVKIQRSLLIRGNDGDMMRSFQHGHISCTLWGNRLASVWGRKQAATKESM